jgi:hypothetical protein
MGGRKLRIRKCEDKITTYRQLLKDIKICEDLVKQQRTEIVKKTTITVAMTEPENG